MTHHYLPIDSPLESSDESCKSPRGFCTDTACGVPFSDGQQGYQCRCCSSVVCDACSHATNISNIQFSIRVCNQCMAAKVMESKSRHHEEDVEPIVRMDSAAEEEGSDSPLRPDPMPALVQLQENESLELTNADQLTDANDLFLFDMSVGTEERAVADASVGTEQLPPNKQLDGGWAGVCRGAGSVTMLLSVRIQRTVAKLPMLDPLSSPLGSVSLSVWVVAALMLVLLVFLSGRCALLFFPTPSSSFPQGRAPSCDKRYPGCPFCFEGVPSQLLAFVRARPSACLCAELPHSSSPWCIP